MKHMFRKRHILCTLLLLALLLTGCAMRTAEEPQPAETPTPEPTAKRRGAMRPEEGSKGTDSTVFSFAAEAS